MTPDDVTAGSTRLEPDNWHSSSSVVVTGSRKGSAKDCGVTGSSAGRADVCDVDGFSSGAAHDVVQSSAHDADVYVTPDVTGSTRRRSESAHVRQVNFLQLLYRLAREMVPH